MDQDMLLELRTEAIDTAEDRLANLNEALQSHLAGTLNDQDTLATIRLEAHSLKAVASSFDMKALRVMCHRFEDYFFNISEITPNINRDLQFYTDRLAECLDVFIQNKEIDLSAIVRTLPNKGGFDVSDVVVSNIEVMLVMEPGIATKIVTRELLECGYRMVNVASTLDAVQLVPAMRPDAVVVSRTMPDLSGIDLACALKAMPLTRDIPVALIATTDRTSGELDDLPDSVPVLRKGGNFADDVADAFVKLGIL